MKMLVVVDMQNDFIDGALGTKEAQEIVPKVAEKIAEYERNNWPIVATQDTHGTDYLNTQEGKRLPVEHCIAGKYGWLITDKINKLCFSEIFHKETFGYIDFKEKLTDCFKAWPYGVPDEIEIVGLCTDICVISNAMILKASFPEIPITVDASCCAGVTPKSHKNALEAMKMCQINIINEGE